MEKIERFDIVTLLDEDDQEVNFEINEVIEIDQDVYAILRNIDIDDEYFSVLKYAKDEDGNDILISLENDEEYEKVESALIDL